MPAPGAATENEIQAELNRVLASRQLVDSPRLSRFLTWIVERTLADETDQVKEYSIGLAVFDRPPDFDPRLDTIVRVQASKLRSRLNEYYRSEGLSNPVQIQLPRGSYVPAFEHPVLAESTAPAAAVSRGMPRSVRLRLWALVTGVVALAFLAGALSAVWIRPHPPRADPVRFQVLAPEGYRFASLPQVSPDGKKLAVGVSRKADANAAIYVYSLESGVGEIQPGTSDGRFPYWAPDGRSLAFTLASKLYRLDLGGAGPVLVAPVETRWGMDWNRNGVILVGGNPGPVLRVSASGTDVRAVTAIARPNTAHAYPRFLPDGSHFLYLARDETPGDSAIYVASLDGGWKKRIAPSETRVQFVATPGGASNEGYILFARSGELLAQPFDVKRLELSGPSRRLAGGIPQFPYGASPFGATSNVLAFATENGDVGQLTWFDRAGRNLGGIGPVADLGDPVLSPDGARVAYDQADGSNRDIWTIEIKSGKPNRITFDPEVDHSPVWSPDSTRIAFESHRAPPGVYVAQAQGGAAESLALPGGDRPSSWSPDGNFLLFDSMRSEPDVRSIRLLPLALDRKPRLWLNGPDVQSPALSPNGKWIAYVSSEFGRSNVSVKSFDAGSAPGSGKWEVSTGGGSQPVWRADGKELFYLSPDHVLMATSVKPGAEFNYDRPTPLFDTRLRVLRGPRNDYTTHDGNRFLIRAPAWKETASPIHVVVNWSAVFNN